MIDDGRIVAVDAIALTAVLVAALALPVLAIVISLSRAGLERRVSAPRTASAARRSSRTPRSPHP